MERENTSFLVKEKALFLLLWIKGILLSLVRFFLIFGEWAESYNGEVEK